MILIHYSGQPLELDFNFEYPEQLGYKPEGLWLSDESESGWRAWCEQESFCLENLKFKKTFKLKEKNRVLVISNSEQFMEFEKKYLSFVSIFPGVLPTTNWLSEIDWSRVKQKHSGIIISRYFPQFRHKCWYNGWDCASGCIWDLKDLETLEKQ